MLRFYSYCILLLSSADLLAAEHGTLTLTPLIESVSIDVAGPDEERPNNVEFREAGSNDWRQGNNLYFDTVGERLSGVIVQLKPDTSYEVRISVEGAAGVYTLNGQVHTRADKPPVDPEKIYNLSDIYDGGILDIEALGIEGEAGAWAMIKGDKETPIIAGDDAKQAIWLGSQSYLYFENIVIEQGGDLGFFAEEAHHLWINGCDISNWGREAVEYRNGRAYDDEGNSINYDSAFFLRRTGVITIENCYVHDPVLSANHWGYGHPRGPNAFIAFTNHPEEAFRGQVILRNNTFTGSDSVRFNDVVESRFNLSQEGGFVRDSAIYNNHFAYANDDIIELDGSQHNVLVYNNRFSHAYGGVSVAPNKRGPSFVFNNTIHKMGDERGEMWASLKAGGVLSNPEGQVNFFNNYVNAERNGITASRVQEDDSYWVNAINNVLLTENANTESGFGIWDPQRDERSRFINNYSFNLSTGSVRDNADITSPFFDAGLLNEDVALSLKTQPAPKTLPVPESAQVPNFSSGDSELIVGITSADVGAAHYRRKPVPGAINFEQQDTVSYANQNKDADVTVWKNELILRGNTWVAVEGNYTVTPDTVLEATVYGEGNPEIAGIGLDSDNRVSSDELLTFYGSQAYGVPVQGYQSGEHQHIFSLQVGHRLSVGSYSQLVFALDNDKPAGADMPLLAFSNVRLFEAVNFNDYSLSSYDAKQDDPDNGQAGVSSHGLMLTLTGNAWKRIEGEFSIEPDTVLVAQVKISGSVELAGIGFDTNNQQGPGSVMTFGGLQTYGHEVDNISAGEGWQRVVIPVGELLEPGDYPYMTFIADNDANPQSGTVQFRHVSLISADSEE